MTTQKRGNRCSTIRRAGWVAVLLLQALTAQAETDPPFDKYAVFAGLGGGSGLPSFGATAASKSTSAPGESAFAAAAGAAGALGVLGSAAIENSNAANGPLIGVSRGVSAWSGASVRMLDGLIAGSGDFIEVPMNLYLDGILSGGFAANPGGTSNGHINLYSEVVVSIYIVSSSTGSYRALRSSYQLGLGSYGQGYVESVDGVGFLAQAPWISNFGNRSISAGVQTDAIRLPVNATFEMQLQVETLAAAVVDLPYLGSEGILNGTASSDFSHTMALLADTPVLVLPSGYSFNMASVGIVDNLCVGSSCVAPVPELPASVLLLLGLPCLIPGWRRATLATDRSGRLARPTR